MRIDIYSKSSGDQFIQFILIGKVSVITTKKDTDITLPGKGDSLRVRKGRFQFVFFKHWVGPTYLRDETDGSYYPYMKRFTPESMLLKIKNRSMGPSSLNVSEDIGFFSPECKEWIVNGYRLTEYGCYVGDEEVINLLESSLLSKISFLKQLKIQSTHINFFNTILEVLRSRIEKEKIEVYVEETIEVEPDCILDTQKWLPP